MTPYDNSPWVMMGNQRSTFMVISSHTAMSFQGSSSSKFSKGDCVRARAM